MFENKHLIIAMSKNIFTELYIDTLISNVGVDADSLSLVSLDNGDNIKKISDEYGISSFYYKNLSIEALSKAQTITVFSLTKFNGFLVKDLLDYDKKLVNKTYILTTEDELDRWVLTKQEHGKLIVTEKNLVSDACLDVLPKLKNFITAESFREEFEYVLDRNNFNIINARDAFSVMPVVLLNKFRELYQNTSRYTLPEKKLLIGAKHHVFSLSETISILKKMEQENILTKYKYMIFIEKRRAFIRILLDIYSLYLRYIKRKNIEISYQTLTNNMTYITLISSCSDILLQRRGSMTTIKEFIQLGHGVVHIKKGTRNERELTKTIGVDVAKYDDFSDLVNNIKSNNINTKENKTKIESYFKNTYMLLRKLYTREH